MEIHKAENEKICEHTIWIFVIYGCLSFLGQIASRKALVIYEWSLEFCWYSSKESYCNFGVTWVLQGFLSPKKIKKGTEGAAGIFPPLRLGVCR